MTRTGQEAQDRQSPLRRKKATTRRPPAASVDAADPRRGSDRTFSLTDEDATSSRKAEFVLAKPKRVFEDIMQQIRRELVTGNLRPGDRLPAERELSRQFGASRTAVREAFRGLENAGILELQKGARGGAFIKEADPDVMTRLFGDMISLGSISIESLTDARIHVLDVVVTLACERAGEADFVSMSAAVEQVEHHSQRNARAARQASIGMFYGRLAEATRNEVMVILVRAITEILRGILLEVSPMPRSETVKTFRNVIAALRKRDSERARQMMRAHLRDLHEYLARAREAAVR